MTMSNWRGRWVRDSIQLRQFLGGNFASLVRSYDCCRILSSIWRGCDAAELAVFLGFGGAAAEPATGARGRFSSRGPATSVGECDVFSYSEAGGHSVAATFFAAVFPATPVATFVRLFLAAIHRGGH